MPTARGQGVDRCTYTADVAFSVFIIVFVDWDHLATLRGLSHGDIPVHDCRVVAFEQRMAPAGPNGNLHWAGDRNFGVPACIMQIQPLLLTRTDKGTWFLWLVGIAQGGCRSTGLSFVRINLSFVARPVWTVLVSATGRDIECTGVGHRSVRTELITNLDRWRYPPLQPSKRPASVVYWAQQDIAQ
ncbi:hypothetical protein UC8_33430 [Roseimaritima ulvae]|uniref:Uncharacterized protein n=1 Tax=Roseimaritima ulvae TaxID=980254 RepID=A0A5B9QQQ5_9BACT|nr:hypothetical protein UC8_33430 [Roseimaritima ulvae]